MNRPYPSSHPRPHWPAVVVPLIVLMLGSAPAGNLRAEGGGPSIGSLEPLEGPQGTVVTIRGSRFGPPVGMMQGTSGVSFNGVWATPSHWSRGEIRVPLPPRASSGPVVVTAGGRASNGLSFTVTGPEASTPAIATLSPLLGPPGTRVTLRGANFGTAQGTAAVSFNGVKAEPLFRSEDAIEATVPEGASSGPVVVTVEGKASSGVPFRVTRAEAEAPRLDWMGPLEGPEGRVVRIEGEHFGPHAGLTGGTSGVSFAGLWAAPSLWSRTAIEVPVPRGAPSGPVVVRVGGKASAAVFFRVNRPPPLIRQVTSLHGPEAALVRIEGEGFGPPLGESRGSSGVWFDRVRGEPSFWSEERIEVPVPAGVWSGPVVVEVDGQESNGWAFTVTEEESRTRTAPGKAKALAGLPSVAAATASREGPRIDALDPDSGPVGLSVTLTGAAFGASQGTATVTFNGVGPPPPAGAIPPSPPPYPRGPPPARGPAGTLVTLAGTSFGPTQRASTVTFNGVEAAPASWSNTAITAPVPEGATPGPVVVTVDGQASNGVAFTVVENRAPAASPIPPQTVALGAHTALDLSAYFSDAGGNLLTYTALSSAPAVATAAVSGTAVTVRGVAKGSATVTITASDGEGSATQAFTVTVPNRAPVPVGPLPGQTIKPGASSTLEASAAFSDPDNDPLSYAALSSDSAIVSVAVSGATVTVTAVAQGSATVTLTASDGELSATRAFTVTVVPNRAPVVKNTIPGYTINKGSQRTLSVATYFSDPDNDPLTCSLSSSNSSKVSVSGCAFTGKTTGSATLTMRASDGELSQTQSFTVTVREPPPENRRPVVKKKVPRQTISRNSQRTLSVTTYFSDPDGDQLSCSLFSPDTSKVSVDGCTFTGTATEPDTVTLTITATDPGGLSESQDFDVTVTVPAPRIDSISPPGQRPDDQVTISGAHFGASGSVSFGGYSIGSHSATSWSSSSIRLHIPGSISAGRVSVSVTANGKTSNSYSYTVTGDPVWQSEECQEGEECESEDPKGEGNSEEAEEEGDQPPPEESEGASEGEG